MHGKPTAVALAHPWPPLPTNLTKRQVLRFLSSEKNQHQNGNCIGSDDLEDIKRAKEFVDQEKRPLKMAPDSTEKELISEIELAIYWDRHAYEFKPKRSNSADPIRKFKSMSSLIDKKLNTADVGVQKDLFEDTADEFENEKRLRLLQIERKNASSQTADLRDAPCQCYCWKHQPHPRLVRSRSAVPKLVKCMSTNTVDEGERPNPRPWRDCCKDKYLTSNPVPKILRCKQVESNHMNLQKRNPALKFNTKPKKSTEYTANFRNPFKIGDAESRILKSKVLNRCFECSRK